MTDLEINSIAEGILAYIQSRSESPLDSIAIVGMTLIHIFRHGFARTASIDRFAEDFKSSLVASYKAQSAEGTGRMQ